MAASTTRAEHLQWCKDRALAYLKPEQSIAVRGSRYGREYEFADGQYRDQAQVEVSQTQVADALASFLSDLGKHPATASHPAILLSAFEMTGGGLKTARQVRDFIEGCN